MAKKRGGPTGISARTLKALDDSGVTEWMREQSRGTRDVGSSAPEYVAQPGMTRKKRTSAKITAPNKRNKRKHYGQGFAPRGKK